MTTKAEAEDDASDRMRWDPSIGKIAYYAIHPNGDFKCIHTKRNPKFSDTKPKPPSGVAARTRKPRRAKPAKQSLLRRMLNLFQ